MAEYHYEFFNSLNGVRAGELDLTDVSYNDPAKGYGEFTGTVVITPKNRRRVHQSLDLDTSMVVVSKSTEQGIILDYAGLVDTRVWKRKTSELTFKAPHVKSWFSTALMGPKITVDPETEAVSIADSDYWYKGKDQFEIARLIMTDVKTVAGAGALPVQIPSGNSGRLRDVVFQGMNFKSAGDVLNTMANRDDGFEWHVVPRLVSDRVELWLQLFYPERSTGTVNLFFESDEDGEGNILDYGEVTESTAGKRTRVWATGDGSAPDQMMTYDDDPDMLNGMSLYRASTTNYSGVSSLPTLASHARVEREALSKPLNLLNLAVKPDTMVGTGDRARLAIKDLWLDYDLPNVRIVDKSTYPPDRKNTEGIALTVDLVDTDLPDTDSGGDAG